MKKATLYSVSGLVLAIALITIFLNVKTEPHVPTKREESQSVDVAITDTESISEAASEIEIETIKAVTSTQTQADEECVQTADTIITTEINTSVSESSEEHGLIIGDHHKPEAYNCGNTVCHPTIRVRAECEDEAQDRASDSRCGETKKTDESYGHQKRNSRKYQNGFSFVSMELLSRIQGDEYGANHADQNQRNAPDDFSLCKGTEVLKDG